MCDVEEITDSRLKELINKSFSWKKRNCVCNIWSWGIERTTRIAETAHNELNALSHPWQCSWNSESWKKYTIMRLRCWTFKESFEMLWILQTNIRRRSIRRKTRRRKKKKEEEKEEEGKNVYYLTISLYILTETELTAEDAIPCRLSTSHGVWAAGFIHNDDGIYVSSFSSPLSTAINWITLDQN